MRKFGRPVLTKKQYKRCLAALGVLALWLAAAAAMMLPSSQASAVRGLNTYARTHSGAASHNGTGGAYPATIGEVLAEETVSAATKKLHELCVGLLPRCDWHPTAEAENSEVHGSGISFSTGNFHTDGGGGYRQATGSDFSAGYGSGGAFAAAFGGLAPSGMGYGGFFAAVKADPVPDGVVTLASVENPDSNNPLRFDPADDGSGNNPKGRPNPPPSIIANLLPEGGPTDGPITTASPPALQAIPEPLTLSLLAGGLMGAVAVRKRKSKVTRAAA